MSNPAHVGLFEPFDSDGEGEERYFGGVTAHRQPHRCEPAGFDAQARSARHCLREYQYHRDRILVARLGNESKSHLSDHQWLQALVDEVAEVTGFLDPGASREEEDSTFVLLVWDYHTSRSQLESELIKLQRKLETLSAAAFRTAAWSLIGPMILFGPLAVLPWSKFRATKYMWSLGICVLGLTTAGNWLHTALWAKLRRNTASVQRRLETDSISNDDHDLLSFWGWRLAAWSSTAFGKEE